MKELIKKLLSRTQKSAGRNRKIRGLSTAELVGIIVIVGILGALGGTYVNGLVTQANTNAGNQNANTLNTVAASVFAGGGTAGVGAGMLDTTSVTTAINGLNAGVTITTNGNPVTYKMTPPIPDPSIASYSMSGTAPNIVFTYSGTTP